MGDWVTIIIKTGKREKKEWLEVEILDLRCPGAIELEVREAHLKFNLKKINIWEFPAFIVITAMRVDEGSQC